MTVYIDLVDQTPLDLLFNGSAGFCTSVDIGQLLIDGMDTGQVNRNPPRPTVTLRDAEGSIVGSVKMPRRGGDFSRRTGCEWGVEFQDIERSNYYEVSIESAEDEYSETGQSIGGSAIELRF